MRSKPKNIKIDHKVVKTKGQVVQKFKINLGGTTTKKSTKGQRGSMRFRGTEPEAEVITSEHVEMESSNVTGRHGG